MKKNFFKTAMLFLTISAFSFVACKKDKDNNNSEPTTTPTAHVVVANGGYVDEPSNYEGKTLKIVQSIPVISGIEFSKARITNPIVNAKDGFSFPANTPIIFFFNDTINIQTVAANITVTVDDEVVFGTLTVNASAHGNAIISFTPFIPFLEGQEISISISTGLQSAAGVGMLTDMVMEYLTEAISNLKFDDNLGFENGKKGTLFIGDGAIIETKGDVSPTEGDKYAAISSGSLLVSPFISMGFTSSVLIAGPINTPTNNITFDYDFMSAEFNDYVGTEFDDSFIVNVFGPNGAISEFVTSVNTVGMNNSELIFPGMPDDGDEYAGHTGWTQKSIDVSALGQPLFVTFIVTDVSDRILSSIVGIDNIRLQ